MESSYSQMIALIWSIADDVLRDVFLRGQYRDVILPMVVLRRTAINDPISLDSEETTIDPNKSVMVGAGGNEDTPKDPLDTILKDFNERWFKGWNATPDDQKA